MSADEKLVLSEMLLAHLKAELVTARTPKTRDALANMIKIQERVVKARLMV